MNSTPSKRAIRHADPNTDRRTAPPPLHQPGQAVARRKALDPLSLVEASISQLDGTLLCSTREIPHPAPKSGHKSGRCSTSFASFQHCYSAIESSSQGASDRASRLLAVAILVEQPKAGVATPNDKNRSSSLRSSPNRTFLISIESPHSGAPSQSSISFLGALLVEYDSVDGPHSAAGRNIELGHSVLLHSRPSVS